MMGKEAGALAPALFVATFRVLLAYSCHAYQSSSVYRPLDRKAPSSQFAAAWNYPYPAQQVGLVPRVIDDRKGELPETVYGGQLLLDTDRSIGQRYGVQVFPTLIPTDERWLISATCAGEGERDRVTTKLGLMA